MRTVVFSTKAYDSRTLTERNANGHGHELVFLGARLTQATALLAAGFPAVCGFVNDVFDGPVLESLAAGGTRLVALRARQ